MPFLSRLLKSRDGTKTPTKSRSRNRSPQNGAVPLPPPKPRWEDAWLRKDLEPEEVQELLRGCTEEVKSRALDVPFLLLPYRPTSDPSAGRTFIRNFFSADRERLRGQRLEQELRLTEPMVICSVMKWCWSRLAGGVVTREAYELFRIGEQDSNMARDAFATFIPISVDSDARTKIIFDFFDLMAAIAAHGKSNGMGGRKLSRLGGWWAFEHNDTGSGFDGGYHSWQSAADATSHLFFAYLRSLSPDSIRGVNGVSVLPRSLQALVEATEYPPERLLQRPASKVVMTVDSVSPTPFALLRRAKHFQYRDDDFILQEFSDYDDPVQALTDECQRVLRSISSANQSSNSMASTSLPDTSWSRFEDIGFTSLGGDEDNEDEVESALGRKRQQPQQHRLRSTPQSNVRDIGRPSTPSWADFLSSGFVDEPVQGPAPILLRPDQMLPPIQTSHNKGLRTPGGTDRSNLEPGELASIITINLDDVFWWVWISSLASEESTERKAAFGRCALIETKIQGGSWLIMEEMVKGAAPEPEVGAYIAEKKSRFGFSTRNRLNRSKSFKNKPLPPPKMELQSRNKKALPIGKATVDPVQHARIQAAASALQQRQRQLEIQSTSPRRARHQEVGSTKTNSVFTLQPVIVSEAAPAMKWASSYDKEAIRAAYLGSNFAGKGSENLDVDGPNATSTNGSVTPMAHKPSTRQDSYGFPSIGSTQVREKSLTPEKGRQGERDLPALPRKEIEEVAPATPQNPISPPLAPLPVPLLEDTRVNGESSAEAAEVPLPSPTPLEQLPPAERKPLPPINQRDAAEVPLPSPTPMEGPSPEVRQDLYHQSVDRKPLPPVTRKESAPLPPTFAPQINGTVYTSVFTTSPPENHYQGKVPKKDNPNAFKGFFGKKKVIQPIRPTPAKPADSAAVAAARAAYPGPDQTSAARSTQHTTLTRRFSNMRRNKSPPTSPAVTPSVPIIRDDDVIHSEPAATAMQYDPPPASPRLERPPTPPKFEHPRGFNESQASISRVDSTEERHAEHEFRSFDQGPLTDQPAFVPHDIPEEPEESLASVESSIHGDTRYEPSDTVSEASIEFPQSQAYPAQDRWAQIRRNAAERAARQSEELSRQSTIDEQARQRAKEEQSRNSLAERTEDGETSGEETIESRVARIRARVVELTSNMDHRVPGQR